MAKKEQSKRLTRQHKISRGVIGIFGDKAKIHNMEVEQLSLLVLEQLQTDFPKLIFRYKKSVSKKEINEAL